MKKLLLLFLLWGFDGWSQTDHLAPADSLFYSEIYKQANRLRETDLDSALYYYEQLDVFLEDKNYLRQRLGVLLEIGNAYLTKGQADRALEIYLEILDFTGSEEDSTYKLYAEISIAGIYLDGEDYQKALGRYQHIREHYRVTDSTHINLLPYCVIYNNEGVANENLGNYAEAETLYRKAIDLSLQISEKYNLANAYSNMGSLKSRMEDYPKALEWHRRALEIREKENLSLGICQSLNHLGVVYSLLGDLAKSEENFKRALDIGVQMGYAKQVIEASVPLKDIYFQKGEFARAFEVQQLELDFRDRVFNEERVKNQERLKAKYEYELEKQIAAKNREFRETVYKFIFGVMLLLLIIALILYLLQKSKTRQGELLNENIKKEKHLLRQELDYKNKKLMSNLMFLLQKNELISSLILKLRDAKKGNKAEGDKIISEIILQLKHHHSAESWEEFDLYFQEVHSDFYAKLSSKFQLTPNEMKLAAFSKLKLSSKEISSLTGQSIRTIDVGRYRLRKKLGINNADVNLTTFLNSL
ncbi:tetratricopeptide repeat protein [Robertkochia flava]|uniref:tetratricopeptide repeat protein n=1 Tax=Robertkochia flava TaxID=3447986 RepID=UPI001CCFB9FC|nr:tetratricopeptide repeat protein [Robertkochia marina]